MVVERLKLYMILMRMHKPIGFFLLLWPCLWALWLAGRGHPAGMIVTIFVIGAFLMRSAGCIINDYADKDFDYRVARTKERPLTQNKVSDKEALSLFVLLSSLAFALVSLLNTYTIALSFIGLALAIIYPFLKRLTHLPQFGLGLAFSWGVPMAYAALNGTVTKEGWLFFFICFLWPIIYDTEYALIDKNDDVKIGLKSTAILFGSKSILIIDLLQLLFIFALCMVGKIYQLHKVFYISVLASFMLFVYQLFLLRKQKFMAAFQNNTWVGFLIFLGILLSYLI